MINKPTNQIPFQLNLNSATKRETRISDFKYGHIWEDPISGHKIGCLDATKQED